MPCHGVLLSCRRQGRNNISGEDFFYRLTSNLSPHYFYRHTSHVSPALGGPSPLQTQQPVIRVVWN